MYDTIIFDLDGTLLNTLDDLHLSMNYALRVHNYPEITLDDTRRFVGNGIRKLVLRAVPEGLGEEETEAVYDTFVKHYMAHCTDTTGPYPGIIELLRELNKRGYKMGIATNKNKDAAEKLNTLYFEGLMTGIAGVVDGKPKKPEPYMVDKVLCEMGSTKEHTLYLGDSQVDVATAKNSGLRMIAVLWGFRSKEELMEAGAEEFIDSPMELLNFL